MRQTEEAPEDDAAEGRNEGYVVTDQVGYLLRRAYQRHLAIFQANTVDPQLTSVQFATLCALREGGPQAQGELVKATSIDQATIRGIVERLKARGLVAFSKDRDDARKVIYSLTGEGTRLVSEMIAPAITITEQTFGQLNPGERLALLFTLRRMIGEA
ncbi:Transcriptional regulator, MarR family (plasmid) [Roseomonas mucosa]|uniref:DNA-binding transcriptional repressor MarR n=1 Tax=Roseomonas mucosa TaxID=207340 RepID=A0A1S8D1N2_9PROT|nr:MULTISPECIES: MarR family winged helix-turn-helix transcriptional regulator [Roseomonas]MDT8266362.1 MarR family winged helix-turn-helix transcriptional regulator [Roseomonas sp. DSM 102946]ATR18860.1 MarR family transcriptional regulator [Roseomonas sp. FDAARGOS_362]AWV20605.1 Transcriptional regulator, MarR family [Roseomonas mucosa]MCG7351260.1 MarR family winged helix-turn-helix transcriptional regulator [Roseomonas mucosa]MCG7356698.1 MarR family winged helix-turn-helix transcriptional